MADNPAGGVSAQTAPDSPFTPTITHYQEVAKAVSAALTAITTLIPSFEAMHPDSVRFVRGHQGFPNDFIATVLAAVEADPQLQSVNKFDVAEARDALQYIEAFRSVIDQVEALLANIKFSCAVRKARVIANGLQVYQIAKGLGRDPQSASVASHARNMKRDLKRPGSKRSKAADPAPVPQTPV